MKTLLAIAAIALAGCTAMPKQPPIRTVDHVNLSRFIGDWYVIGTIPWFVEKNNVGTMDIYKLRPDGKIDIRYAFHKKSLDGPRQEMKATASVVNSKTNAEYDYKTVKFVNHLKCLVVTIVVNATGKKKYLFFLSYFSILFLVLIFY